MKIWFDTEFIEDGHTIELLSIGMVREDGEYFYAEPAETDRSKAGEWVQKNVIPHLPGPTTPKHVIREALKYFCGERPEFWAYYCSYDWVVLCQLFGTMMDLPKTWPMFCNDVKQLCYQIGNPRLPEQSTVQHNALNDAAWTMEAHEFLLARIAHLSRAG